MRRRIILLALILVAAQSIAVAQATPALSEVPFSLQKGFVIVAAKIKGNVPVVVVLATGADNSFTDPAFLKKYDLSAGYAADGPVTGRNDKTYGFAIVNNLSVGENRPRNLNMRFGSLANLSTQLGQEIFAILGADFFKDQAVQFDFKNKVIRFFDKLPAELTDTKNPNFNATKTTVLKMAPKESNPFQATLLVPVVQDVQINGQKTKLLIDTGIATSLVVSSATAKKVGLTVPAEGGPPRDDKVTLVLNSSELTDLPVLIYAKGTLGDERVSKYGAMAGSVFLQSFVATFDYKKSVVVLERL
jgi:hypothetical protein